MKVIMNINQKGFSPLLLLVLLGAGIIAGVYLVGNGINFLPSAQEQEGLNPSAGKTKDCSTQEDKEKCQAENDAICFRDTVTYCDNREGSPRAIRKSGGYYDPSHGNTDPKSGCVFDYREVADKNSECGKSESKSGDVVYTTTEEAEKLDTERKNTSGSRASQAAGSGSTASGTTDAQCTEPGVEDAMKDEKVTGNLVRLHAILAGAPGYCTPADLGAGVKLEEKGANGQMGRTMLCSGDDGAMTWRVIQGTKLEPAQRQTPTDVEGVETFLSSYIAEALKIASPK